MHQDLTRDSLTHAVKLSRIKKKNNVYLFLNVEHYNPIKETNP